MQPSGNSKWIKRVSFALVLLSTLACTIFGFDLTGTSGQTVEVTRIVPQTVIVAGSDTVITAPPVIIEITRQVEVTRRVEVPVTRVVTATETSPPINLEGTWYNPSTHSETTIVWRNNTFEATHIVDNDDGDVYPVTSSGWDGTSFTWSYYVPDTTYHVIFSMTSLVGNNLNCYWFNDHDASGTRTLQRQ
jgi:hypothetical protein